MNNNKPYFNVEQYLHENATEMRHGADGQSLQQQFQTSVGADGGQTEFNRLAAAANLRPPAPYVIRVANTTGADLNAVLFGTALYMQSTNYGSDVGVRITSASGNISYFQMLIQIITQPYKVGALRVIASTESQATEEFNITSFDSSGQSINAPIFSDVYQSSFQNNPKITDINYPLTIDANTALSFTILAGATAKVIFFPDTKTNPVKTLDGTAAITQYAGVPITIGIPVASAIGTVRPGLL